MDDQALVSLPKLGNLKFTFADSIDNPEILDEEPGTPDPTETKEPEIPTPPTQELKDKAPETKQPETPEIPEAPESKEPEKQESQFSLILKSYQATDKLIPEDVEIPSELDGKEFKRILKEVVKREVLEESAPDLEVREAEFVKKLEENGIMPWQIEYATAIAQGVDKNTINRVHQLRNWAAAELTTDQQREEAVRIRLGLEGNKKELIDTYISTELNDAEKLKAAAEDSQKVIGEIAESEFAEERQQKAEEQKAEQARIKAQNEQYEKVIDKGFFGITLNKEQKDKLRKYLFSRDVVKEIDTPNGKKPVAYSQETWDLMEIEQDPEKRIFYAYITMGGLKEAANNLHKETSDNFLKKIETITSNPPKSKEVVEDQDEFLELLGNQKIISIPNRR